MTIYEVVEIFTKTFAHIASMEEAVNGFEVADIWPFNSGVFNNQYFLPSEVTNVAEFPEYPNECDTNQSLPDTTDQQLPDESHNQSETDHFTLSEATTGPSSEDVSFVETEVNFS